jgi:hypothetical protein
VDPDEGKTNRTCANERAVAVHMQIDGGDARSPSECRRSGDRACGERDEEGEETTHPRPA